MAKKNNKANKQRKNRVYRGEMLSHPPMMMRPVLEVKTYRLRYAYGGTGGSFQIQPFQLIQSIFTAQITSTTVKSVVEVLKIRFVEVWTSPAVGANAGNNLSASLGWVENNNFGANRWATDTTMTVSPAHVRLAASTREASGMWQGSGGNQPWTLVLVISTNSVLDFVFDVRLNNGLVATDTNSTITVAAANPESTLGFVSLTTSGTTPNTDFKPVGVLAVS